MWQTDITIDSKYNLASHIDKFLKTNNFRYLYETMGSRDIFSICESTYEKYNNLKRFIKDILLIRFKYLYLIDRIGSSLKIDEKQLLLAEMLFFDTNFESDYLDDILPCETNFSLDGIYNFKMRELKLNWDYLIELYNRVGNSSDDMHLLSKYMHESASVKNKRVYAKYRDDNWHIFDISSGNIMKSKKVTNDIDINFLYDVIYTHTDEVYIDGSSKFSTRISIFDDIISIKFV